MLRFSPTAVLFCIVASLSLHAHARSFRVFRIPNGTVAGCANCHVSPNGGGTRTAFGAAVFTAIGGTSADVPFWSVPLASMDSDGDGVSNGAELRDPDGDGTPSGNTGVTNPGNRPPIFSSTPVASATKGLAYTYSATATDTESNGVTFTKVAGPSWLSVSAAGQVSGIPPGESGNSATVTIRASDSGTATQGYSLGSTSQTYTLNISASYPGWQALNFTLPAEAALAAPLADPDLDGLANLLEYAVRLPARATSSSSAFAAGADAQGRLATLLLVRDDDPKLSIVMETADNLEFAGTATIAPIITDAVPGDGFLEYTFVDNVTPAEAAARFSRLRVRLLP